MQETIGTANSSAEERQAGIKSGTFDRRGRVFSSVLVSGRPGGLESETHRIFQMALSTLHDAGISPADVVRTRARYVNDGAVDAEAIIRDTHGVVFDRPGLAFSAIRATCLPDAVAIAVELEEIRGAAGRIKHFGFDEISATSVATFCDGECWLSGMTAAGDDVSSQVAGISGMVGEALAEFGMTPADVVSTRHFMLPEAQFPSQPKPWSEFMAQAIPTSAVIAVEGVAADRLFMLECEAVQGASKGRKNLRSGRTYEVEHNYCLSVRATGHDVTYVAGSTSLVVGEIVRHEFDVDGQVRDTLETIRWAIEGQGMAWTDLVKTRTYVVGGPGKLPAAMAALNDVLGDMEAASTVVGVPTLSGSEVVVEIEATAVVSS